MGPSPLKGTARKSDVEELTKDGLTGNLARSRTGTVQVCPHERTDLISARCWRGATPKHRHFLLDENIKRWYDNVPRGSKITADVYLRRLGSRSSKRGIKNPKELIAHAGRGESGRWAYNFLVDIVTQLEGEGRASSYLGSNLKAVKSWLLHNGIANKSRKAAFPCLLMPITRPEIEISSLSTTFGIFFYEFRALYATRCKCVDTGLRLPASSA